MEKYNKEFINMICSVNDIDELSEKLNEITVNKTRGTYFEWFAKLLLLNDPRYTNFVETCWLLDELPEKIRKKLKIPENDIGIDIVIETHDKEYFAVQVKYRKNINCEINWTSLSTFFGLAFGLTNKFAKGIFFTNTLNPNKYVKNNSNVINILHHSLKEITQNTFIKIRNGFKKTHIELFTYEPRPYQQKIITKAKEYYDDNCKGRLYMPCGTGKTLVCYWISDELAEHKRICIVVPSLYLLSQMYSVWIEMKQCKYLLIGSDAEIKTCDDTGLLLTTQPKEIKKYLEKYINNDVVIITTYQSSEVLSNVCKKLEYELDLIIYDEAHKTVGTSERAFSCLLDDDNIKTKKRLFTTATEKIYSGDDEDILSMDNTDIYGDVIYSYSFKKAIENGQLCDYQVIAPMINDEGFWKIVKKNKYVIDKKICEDPIESRYYMTAYLLCRNIVEKGLKHVLTFNNTNSNAKLLHGILEKMLTIMEIECNCYHLSGESSMKKRKRITDQFVKDDCAIISSARIFQEGVDIPIVDCVCFVDNKMSVIDIIQSIGRTLRKHDGKELGYVLVPTLINIEECDENIFDVSPDDFGNIKNILKALGTIDDRIIDEFTTKNCKHSGSNKFVVDMKNVSIASNIKIDVDDLVGKIDTIICDRWGCVNWDRQLADVKAYIDKYHKRPSMHSEDIDIKKLGHWLSQQLMNYNKRQHSMKNKCIYEKWRIFADDYMEYFKSIEEIWIDNLNSVKKYITDNDKRPSSSDENLDVRKLGHWIIKQKLNYTKKRSIMNNDIIINKWNLFMKEYEKYLKSANEIWNDNLIAVKKYIYENTSKPSRNEKLGVWVSIQRTNYIKKRDIMKNKTIRKQWALFVNEYNEYFKSNDGVWDDNLNIVKEYMDKYHKRPSCSDKNEDIRKIGLWLQRQKENYYKKTKIMKYGVFIKKWDDFIREYGKYIKSNNEEWDDTLNIVKKYIDENNKIPSQHNKNAIIKKLGTWISRQRGLYSESRQIMKDITIRKKWNMFIDEYEKYFKSKEELWNENLIAIKKYINENNKRPSHHDKNKDIKKMGSWISRQLKLYPKKHEIMKDPSIRKQWETFISEYKNILLNNGNTLV